jgi:4-carboxymuconolactone decarboxylase
MLGRSIGLSDNEIAGMAEAAENPLFDDTDRLVIRYSEVLTRENRVGDELYAQLAARFSREELVELCFTVGLAALVNRVHATFRTDPDPSTQAEVGESAFCPIGR